MASAVGRVLRNGEVIGFFEWNHTSDTAWNWVYKTESELEANWHRHEHGRDYHRSGTCAATEPLSVVLDVHGDRWPGKVCPMCWTIIDGADPYGDFPDR